MAKRREQDPAEQREKQLADPTRPQTPTWGWRRITRWGRRIAAKPALWRELAWACGGYAVLLGIAIAVLPTAWLMKPINSWNVFHYVLGTKYFDELGYFDFYDGVLLADREGRNVLGMHQHTRNLRTYRLVKIERAIDGARRRNLKQRFTAARWRELKRDVAAILELRTAAGWGRTIKDRGFNPSPVWLLIHEPLLNLVNIRSKRVLAALCYAQMFLYFITFAFAWWAFGPRATLLGGLWFALYHGNWGLKLGGYFSHDWFCYTICALALFKKKRPWLAGAVLAYPAMMRGFPGLLALYPAVAWLKRGVRLKKPAPRHTVFLVTLVVSCFCLIALASLDEQGFGVWKQWKQKITTHAKYHRYYCWRVGLRYFFVHDYCQDHWRIALKKRAAADRRNAKAYYATAAALVCLTLLAMLRRRENDGLILAVPVIFFTLVLSRYYLSIGVLLFAWHDFDRRRLGNKLSAAWLFLLIAFYAFQRLVLEPPCRATYHYFNAGLTLYFLVVVGHFLQKDVRWLFARLKKRLR
jgi:hypothetical protein